MKNSDDVFEKNHQNQGPSRSGARVPWLIYPVIFIETQIPEGKLPTKSDQIDYSSFAVNS